MTTNNNSNFVNQVKALGEITNSLGEIILVDAHLGYGKTSFLKELHRRYSTQGWRSAFISLDSVRNRVDLISATLNQFSKQPARSSWSSDEISAQLELIRLLQSREKFAFFFDDVHRTDPEIYAWIQGYFSKWIKEELTKYTQGNFLLVFAGVNTRAESWPTHRKIVLAPFDRNTITNFVSSIQSEELREFTREARYTRWLVEKLMQYSGGHPKTLMDFFEVINNGNWKPYEGVTNTYDKQYFDNIVNSELRRFTNNLSEDVKTLLKGLSVFRKVNTSTIGFVRRTFQLTGLTGQNYSVLTYLKSLGLIDKNAELEPLLRNGSVSQMIFDERNLYTELNRLAQYEYEKWIESELNGAKKIEVVENGVREGFYHCLCHTRAQYDIATGIKKWLNDLSLVLELNEIHDITSHKIIRRIAQEDDDIQRMLDDYSINLSDLFDLVNSLEGNDPPSNLQKLNCQKSVVAIYDDDMKEIVGTGFWMKTETEFRCLITCGHVLKSLNKETGESLFISPNDTHVGTFQATVLSFFPPQDRSPSNWKAKEDIAVLVPVTEDNYPDEYLTLDERIFDEATFAHSENFFSFGYPLPYRNKGEMFNSLKIDGVRANGFVKLQNLGKSEVDQGISGSPLCDISLGRVIGMIQARKSPDQVYFIPSKLILEVVEKCSY